MAKKATKDQKDQVETLSYINTLVTVLGDYPEATLPLTMNTNPFGFLIDICKSLGIFDELMLFLVKTIQYILPTLELGIKGILLANLKETVSCSSDPYIPNYLRKQIYSTSNSGITLSITDIDYNDLLSISPFSNGSEYSYLGIDRSYRTSFAIQQNNFSEELETKTSDTFYKVQPQIMVTDWLQKQYERMRKKYPTAVIESAMTTENVVTSQSKTKWNGESYVQTDAETTTGYKGTIRAVKYFYNHEVGDNIIPPIVSGWTTYLKADSHLQTKTRKYKKEKAKELSEGAQIITSITPIINTGLYELARAKDFDAFLWFLTHQADFSKPYNLEGDLSLNHVTIPPAFGVDYIESKSKVLGKIVLRQKQKEKTEDPDDAEIDPNYLPAVGLLGSTFNLVSSKSDSTSALIDLCILVDQNEQTSKSVFKKYIIVPASSDDVSLNWYADRSKYFDFLKYYASPKKEASQSPRDYNNEFGICNLEFDTSINDTNQYSNFTRNQIRFTVLPKPLIYIPHAVSDALISGIQSPWGYKKILFNNEGEFDKNGKLSVFVYREINVETNVAEPKLFENEASDKKDFPFYYVLNTKGQNSDDNSLPRLYIPSKWSTGIKITDSKGDKLDNIPLECLYECYPNLTIYEFNYDYIMSQRLFDPLVVAGELIESLLNCRLGISGKLNVNVTRNVTEGTERLVEIIKNIITADTYASSDCYSSFSNEKYDELSRKTEQKKAQGYHFQGSDRTVQVDTTNIQNILNEYNDPDITQEGQVDVLNRAFQEATASITAATEDKETWDVKFNIIQQLIEDLTFTVVKSILTPKILLILAVNKQLMGDYTEYNGNSMDIANNLISGVLGKIIVDIVKEIKDILLKQLLDFVLGFLKPKFAELASLIIKEYTEQYREQLAALIKACGLGWGWHAATADTQLDTVDYADIDPISGEILDTQC